MKQTERDQMLVNYAKASGAFYASANKYMADKTNEHLQEAQSGINNLTNRELPKVEKFCKDHEGEEGIDSLLAIAKTDCADMQKLFARLK